METTGSSVGKALVFFAKIIQISVIRIDLSILTRSCTYRPWWPSGLIHHVSNSSRDRWLGPRLESRLGHVKMVVKE